MRDSAGGEGEADSGFTGASACEGVAAAGGEGAETTGSVRGGVFGSGGARAAGSTEEGGRE